MEYNKKTVNTSLGEITCREYEDRLEFRGLRYATAKRWEYPVRVDKNAPF